MKPLANIDTALDAGEAWWIRQNDQPMIHAIFQQGEYEEVLPWKKDWMSPGLTDGWSPYSHEQLFGQALELHLQTGEDQFLCRGGPAMVARADPQGARTLRHRHARLQRQLGPPLGPSL